VIPAEGEAQVGIITSGRFTPLPGVGTPVKFDHGAW
jgi:hypothetical protein